MNGPSNRLIYDIRTKYKKLITYLSENTQTNRLISFGEVNAVNFDNYTKHALCLKQSVFNLKIFKM